MFSVLLITVPIFTHPEGNFVDASEGNILKFSVIPTSNWNGRHLEFTSSISPYLTLSLLDFKKLDFLLD